LPERVRQQVVENSTRELADFLRSTGPDSFRVGTPVDRRGSTTTVGTTNNVAATKVASPRQSIRSIPSSSMVKARVDLPPVSSSKPLPRSAVSPDPEHSTLQLAAFIRTTGPPPSGASPTPITVSSHSISDKQPANSVHSNGDSSTEGLLKYQSARSQRYPPSPTTSATQCGALVDDDDSEDLELSMYPGVRKNPKGVKEESLLDFLRSTGPPEPALPPSPTTPKALQDRFPRGKKSQPAMRSETPQPKAIDIFAAAKTNPPRAMSPTPSGLTTGTIKGSYQVGGSIRPAQGYSNALNVHVPSPSIMGNDDYFSMRTQSIMSRQSSVRQARTDMDDIQSIRTQTKSIMLGNGPREPVSARSHTTDSLADFLRNTGPADFDAPQRTVKKSKSGFFRRFLGGNNTETKSGRYFRSGSVSGRFTPIVIPATVKS
jgi:hypothetical protein